jgi:hypothetical protein
MSSRKVGSVKKGPAVEYAMAEAMVVEEFDDVDEKVTHKNAQHHGGGHHHSALEHAGANTHNIKQWPPALREKLVQTFKRPHDERKASALLSLHEWPEGLKATIFKSCKKIPLRFFIVDDSGNVANYMGHFESLFTSSGAHTLVHVTGSMILNDGKKIVKQGKVTK